jgi:HEAT repeat protein
MIDWPPDDNAADQLPALSAMLAELATADASRRRELLAAISDLTWKIGPNAAAAIPVLLDWPLGGDRESEERVCHALSNCAPASIAPLLKLLEHPSELARLRACDALRRIGPGVGDRLIPAADALLVRLEDVSDPVRREAALALGQLGDQREATSARLIDVARTAGGSTRTSALHAIRNICNKWAEEELRRAPASFAPLLELLEHPSELARLRACSALLRMGQGAGDRVIPAADALLTRLEDVSDVVRIEAAFALGLLGDQREATVARLVDIARTSGASTRASALHAIGNICSKRAEEEPGREGPAFAGTADVVLAGLDDADADVRRSACHALGYLGLPASQHLERILRILEADPSGVMRDWAASQLPALAERADISSAVATLARLLGDAPRLPSPSSSERSLALLICEALGRIGPGARAAVPALLEALNDDRVALWAAEALWRIERRAELVLPTLDREFDGNGEIVCDIVCEMGPEARPLLPKLLDALARDDYWDLQWAAADAIGRVASADPETLQALQKALTHESGIVRSAAAKSLANIGASAVPLLIDMLSTDIDPKTQEWVADALSRMGPVATSAAPILRAKLGGLRRWAAIASGKASAHRGLRAWAAIALGKVASDADAVPALIEILEDEGLTDAWQAACEALAAIGAPAAASREHLMALATCPIDKVRQAAELAVAAIDRPPS